MSHEELAEIDPHNETRSNPASSGGASSTQPTAGKSTTVPETNSEKIQRSLNSEVESRRSARSGRLDRLYPEEEHSKADSSSSRPYIGRFERGLRSPTVRESIFSVPDSETSSSDSSYVRSPVLTAALADNPFTETSPKPSSPILEQTKAT